MHILSLRIIGLVVLLFITNSYGCDNYSVNEVTSGIYYHQGVHEDASEKNIGAIANVGFIIGERCVAVIDSGGSYLEGTYLRQAIKKHTDLPICYVINTHVHPDHLLGNAAFKDDTPEYIGHEKLPAALAAREDYFARVFEDTLGSAYAGTEFIAPTMTVRIGQPVTIDLGNRPLTLTAYTTSHTDHDLTILDNDTNTLWTGDLLFMERIPVMDGSINGWIETTQHLQSMDLNFVIPGHGIASKDKWQQGLANQLRYFNVLRDEIRVIIDDLGTIDQASKQVGIPEQNSWELFDLYHRRNVTASFVQLEWE
ncbi:MAG: quinoprotein relay system zinc metallohydrolase 2 [Gammaproteobacteria bacterium]|nr:MAG: quinoprotein relay system zinc metallohydrolase 2 [Gammaproteobacteria bacterium]RLA01463.1 MAG: quinoprotein relay system zinc metallohydrolase 2 [Gammaproteobacteria bacterium]